MILLFEPGESWSLMMLITAVAIDNADLSPEGKEAIRRWRSERNENSPLMADLTEAMNEALNSHIDKKFLRRIKKKGYVAETVRK